jgi:hypothetical protein
MDSRAYVFIFPINGAADVPADFRTAVQDRKFEKGIFLPQDDTTWFTRPPKYPARLLLLGEHRLSIVAHPSAGQSAIDIDLDKLVQLETGNILLLGWIQLRTASANHHLIYNTRASQGLDDFIAAVRRRWLRATGYVQPVPAEAFGQELEIKFSNLLHYFLDRGEHVLLRYFMAPIELKARRLMFQRVKSRPGHLVALTSGNRLLWLRDERRGRCERYAGIAVSAPVWLIHGCTVITGRDHNDFEIQFKAGPSWRFAVHGAASGYLDFSRCLNALAKDWRPPADSNGARAYSRE